MKKTCIALLSLLLLVGFIYEKDKTYVASRKSDTYHRMDCPIVKRIKPINLIYFDGVDKAVTAGYLPCDICKPPMGHNEE
jgi:methylphosphotriester-DNA--protein-cysteine methyltransferase